MTPVMTAVATLAAQPGGGGGPWGIFLNDSLGDCVCADSAHQVMLHTANSGAIVVPTDDQVEALYGAVGGYVPGDQSTDQGCDETSMCQYMMTTGLAGQKSAGTGVLDPTNMDHLRWATQIFGACRLGITVTDDMMSAFAAGQPWTAYTGNVDGGHDPLMVQYDAQYVYVVTWAKLQPVAWSLMANANFLQEAHAEAYPDWVRAGGTAPSGFDLEDLISELANVEATEQ